MAKTHNKHLKDHGYKPTGKDPYNSAAAEKAYQTLVRLHGDDNVWDYRVLDEVFDTTHAELQFGIILAGVRKRDTDEIGSLSMTDFLADVPRFYYDWRRAV